MRELTLDEVEAVSGGFGTGGLWGWLFGYFESGSYMENGVEVYQTTYHRGVLGGLANDPGYTVTGGNGFAVGFSQAGGSEFIGAGLGYGISAETGAPSGFAIAPGLQVNVNLDLTSVTGMVWWKNNNAENAEFWERAFDK